MTEYKNNEIVKDKSFIVGAHKYPAPVVEAGLYLVATPIGNLSDISLRALETLAGVDLIACEDTRTSGVLLNHYGIRQKTISYHEHNAATAGEHLLAKLQHGARIALICDAGTPLLSDPGYPLVEQAVKANIDIFPIPGASALLSALTACGLPTNNFFFGGFLPPKKTARQKALNEWQNLSCTLVFYESPHRVGACLADMAEVFGQDRPACLCRELTKKFETFDHDNLGELARRYAEKGATRGEIVLVIGGAEHQQAQLSPDAIDSLLVELAETLPASKAAHEVAKQTGEKKQALYARLLELKNQR